MICNGLHGDKPGARFRPPFIYRLLTWLDRHSTRLPDAPPGEEAQVLGRQGEELAYWFLRRQGYTIMARNYRPRSGHGEIDLIALDGDVLVFVEVKTRRRHGMLPAEAAVNWQKRRRLLRAARTYARRRGEARCRFDVVAIYDPAAPRPEIHLYRNAFGARREGRVAEFRA